VKRLWEDYFESSPIIVMLHVTALIWIAAWAVFVFGL
jgi:hypothetical protein